MKIEEKIKECKKNYDDLERIYNRTLKKDRKQVLHDKMIDVFARYEVYKECKKELKLEDKMIDLISEEYFENDNYNVEDFKDYWSIVAKRALQEEEKKEKERR